MLFQYQRTSRVHSKEISSTLQMTPINYICCFQNSYLNNTLIILNRRIDSMLETVERSVFRLLPESSGIIDHEYIEQFCRLPMLYFEQVCSSYVEQMYSGYIR